MLCLGTLLLCVGGALPGARGGLIAGGAMTAGVAAAVLEWLAAKGGVERSRLVSRGHGAERPLASNEEEAGRQRNRRVELRVIEYRAP